MKLGTDSVALGAWTEIQESARTALDVGAGSGVLALMLAQRAPQLLAVGLEYDAGADCRRNFAASPWAGRLTVVEGNFQDYCPDVPVDLIISNPPYFASGLEAPSEERALARHEGSLNYFSLVGFAALRLSDEGSLAMILPAEKYDDALYRAELARLKLRRLAWLLPSEGKRPIRVMMQFMRRDGHCHQETIAVRRGAAMTSAFATLTRDFYL